MPGEKCVRHAVFVCVQGFARYAMSEHRQTTGSLWIPPVQGRGVWEAKW